MTNNKKILVGLVIFFTVICAIIFIIFAIAFFSPGSGGPNYPINSNNPLLNDILKHNY